MSLNEINIKRHAQDLERNLRGVYHFIKDRYEEFRELCRVFNPERGYSSTTIRGIRERFKEINAKFAEARSLEQLLRSKYKGTVQLDPQKHRELEELYFMYKREYRYFEQNQTEWEQMVLGKKELPRRILSHLQDIYRETLSLPSLILCFQGGPSLLETIKKRIKLGKRDICEEREGEIWFFMAGIRALEDSILRRKLFETLFEGLNGGIKGVAFKITKGEDGTEEAFRDIHQALAEVQEGEIKIL
ncbi:MAG: hypothetical protein JRI46_05340 [Deltaproteobacteria bacterium]|nr:hypothetical protein [Deltaproteobacteria bacterium]